MDLHCNQQRQEAKTSMSHGQPPVALAPEQPLIRLDPEMYLQGTLLPVPVALSLSENATRPQ